MAEDLIMKFMIVFCLIPLFGVLLGYFGLLYWWLLLIPLCIFFIILTRSNEKTSKHEIIAIVLSMVLLGVFLFGAYRFPWLEDGDPYGYAVSSVHISETHSFTKDVDLYLSNYAEPDPVGYSILMGTIHQLSGNISDVLKRINALIVAMTILASFYFFKSISDDENLALAASFILFAIPSFLTHFIFATSYAVLMFLVAGYCMFKKDKLINFLGMFVMISLFLTHHLTSFAFLLFVLVVILFNKNRKRYMISNTLSAGAFAGFIWYVPMLMKYSWAGIKEHIGFSSAINIAGTADKVYSIYDFIMAKSVNMINVSVGWGPAVFLLLLLGLLLLSIPLLNKQKLKWQDKTMLVYFIITLILVNLAASPIKLMPFRWWTFMAIPVAYFASQGLLSLKNKKVIMVIAIIGILTLSFAPKVKINTSVWGASQSYMDEMEGLLNLKELSDEASIFSFVSNQAVIGFDKKACMWCKEQNTFRGMFLETSPPDIAKFMRDNNYKYLFINGWYVKQFGLDNVNKKIREIGNSNEFTLIKKSKSSIILEVK